MYTKLIAFQENIGDGTVVKMLVSYHNNFSRTDFEDLNGAELHCNLIASDFARKAIELGLKPYVVGFRDPLSTIKPQWYGDVERWGSHQIAVIGTTVYDPLLGIPVQLKRLFGCDIWTRGTLIYAL